MRIGSLNAQTGYAIDEATAKNLLTQAKLNNALTKVVPGSPECLDILRTLTKLYRNWEELNDLKRDVFWYQFALYSFNINCYRNLLFRLEIIKL